MCHISLNKSTYWLKCRLVKICGSKGITPPNSTAAKVLRSLNPWCICKLLIEYQNGRTWCPIQGSTHQVYWSKIRNFICLLVWTLGGNTSWYSSRFSVCRYEPLVETQAGIFQVLVTPLAMDCTVFCFDKVSKEFRSSSIFFYFYKSGLPIQFQERVASHIWSDTTLQILHENCAIWLSNTYMKTGPKFCIWNMMQAKRDPELTRWFCMKKIATQIQMIEERK